MRHSEGILKASGNGVHIGMKCIAVTHAESKELRDADARRIAACWNACAGISNEALEVGSIQGRIKSACMELREVREGLRSAISKAEA